MSEPKIKYLSNSPVSDSAFYKDGVDAIKQMVDDKDVFNIGIIAPYAAGKSSLIKTYCDDNKKLGSNIKTIVDISLLDLDKGERSNKSYDSTISSLDVENKYAEEKNTLPKAEKWNRDKLTDNPTFIDDSLLEKSILEQLFFKENRAKLPFSRIDRIHNRVPSIITLSALIVLSILSILLTVLCYNKYFKKLPDWFFYLFLAISCLLVFSTIFVFLFSSKMNKISIYNIEVEFEKIKNGSVLNLFLDEIIYYFKKTKIDVVVFEDIDRFGSIKLFTKLREMNRVLNSNKRIKRKITFIYCVSDDFFQKEQDRAKFFEFVLSLVPVFNNKNGWKYVNSSLSDDGLKIDPSLAKQITRFIVDKRILNNIINDYIYFYKSLDLKEKELSKEKLFSMMVYKNVMFKDYIALINGKSVLSKLFGEYKTKAIENAKSHLLDERVSIDKSIDNLRSSTSIIRGFEQLKKIITGIIATDGTAQPSVPTGFVDISTIKTFQDFSQGIYVGFFSVVSNGYYNQTRGATYKSLTFDEIVSKLGEHPFDIEKSFSSKFFNSLLEQRSSIEKKINEINSLSIKNIILKGYSTKEINDLLNKDSFLNYVIRNGYIDESYYLYIGQQDSKVDSSFINSVLSHQPVDPLVSLDNCDLIINEIDAEEFSNRSIFNYSLIEYLFSTDKNLDKKEVFLNGISSLDDDSAGFVINYIKSLHSPNHFISLLSKKNPKVIPLIFNSNQLDEDLKFLVLKSLYIDLGSELLNFNMDGALTYFIEQNSHPLERMLSLSCDSNEIIDLLSGLNVSKIEKIDFNESNNVWGDVFRSVVNNKWFGINYHNLEVIEKFYLKNNQISVTSLLNKKNSFSNYLYENLNDLVRLVSNGDTLQEDESTISTVVKSDDISYETKSSFLKALNSQIPCFDGLTSDLCNVVLQNNGFIKQWQTLAQVFKIVKENAGHFLSFVVDNIDSIQGKIEDGELGAFLVNGLEQKDFSVLSAIIDKDNSFVDILTNYELKPESLAFILRINNLGIIFKKSLVLGQSETIKSNISNSLLCNSIISVIMELKEILLDTKTVDKLIENATFDRTNKEENSILLDIFEGRNLVNFVKKMDPELIIEITKDDKDETSISTLEYEANMYLNALLNKGVVKKSGKKAKKNTKINVRGVLLALKNEDD